MSEKMWAVTYYSDLIGDTATYDAYKTKELAEEARTRLMKAFLHSADPSIKRIAKSVKVS